ncbi:Hypothetical predicted protein [Scomber scombrus]|uniref:Uncharacterized protein n=1 Tax=Scomber scombrus TaxID=13677 RepID=A0AAV1MT10_SCOSC
MDGLLKGDSEPGQQRVTELQWKHNGDSPSPNASHLPSLGFLSRCRPCQATTRARLVQQSRNKTTLINANWGEKQQTAYTFKFYTELVRANSSSNVLGKTLTLTNPILFLTKKKPRPIPNLFIHCQQYRACRWSEAPAASWFTAGDREAFR